MVRHLQQAMKTSLNEFLTKLYYSLDSSPVSYAGAEKLFKYGKTLRPSLTRKDVNKWLSSQLAYSLHKPARVKVKTRPVIVYDVDEQWQLDLVDLSKLSKYNSGYKYLLVCIDILSKYAWVEALKTKTGSELKGALERVFKRDNRQPKLIQTDKGSEFYNASVKKLLQDRNIVLFSTNSERKASVVERLNRTLKSLMFKVFTRKNTRKYIDDLPDIVSRYNRSVHSSIKMAPVDVNSANTPLIWINLYGNRLQHSDGKSKMKKTLNIGDHVRISTELRVFQKRYEEIWTEEIFIVTHKIFGNPMLYKLKDQHGEAIKGTFYGEELQKVIEPSTYRIEKVIRKKRDVNGDWLYLVKWKGYSDKFNSFVSGADIEKL